MKNFVFGGFLPRDPEERLRQLKNYKQMRMPIILMDTPYRLTNLLSDISKVFGKNQRITLTLNLTLPNEWILTGACDELIKKIGPMKAEFMLIIHQVQQAARNEK